MPNPPQYIKDSNTVELSPLMKSNHSSFDIDLEAQVTSEGRPVEVTFILEPRYPVICERQDVIGLLGKSRQQAFAVLADYPLDRIEFLAAHPRPAELLRNGLVGGRWAVVMDSAWPRFKENPPASLMVRVKDGPGDELVRIKHFERQEFWKSLEEPIKITTAFTFIFSVLFLVVTIIRYYMAANPIPEATTLSPSI